MTSVGVGRPGEEVSGEPVPAEAIRQGRTRPVVVLAVAALGVFMAFVDDTVVGIAFPDMVHSFHGANLSELSWVLNAYNIAFAAFMIPAGRFADVFGRRRLYVTGIVVFTLGSALSAAAPSLGVLIAARAVQGLGAAAIVPASLAIVLNAYPAAKRAHAVAIWSATAAIAAGVGPSIGGLLVDVYNWRLVFLINLPIGVVAYWLSRRELVESRAPGRRLSPDLGGAALLAAAVGALTLAIVQGPDWGWASAAVILAAAASVLGGVVLARRCLSHASPVIDLELLRAPGFSTTSALTFVGAAGFFALGLANVLFMIQVWHFSPLQAGLAFTPAPFLAALAAGASGQLAQRVDPRRLVLIGAVIWTCGPLFLYARATPEPAFLAVYFPAAALAAVGIGLAFPLISDAAVAAAPAGRFAGATALNGSIRQVGAAVGVAILAATLGHSERLDSVGLYHAGWLFAAGCFAVVAVGSLALAPFRAPDLADEQELARRRSALIASAPSPRPRQPAPSSLPRHGFIADSDEALLTEVAMFAPLPAATRRTIARRAATIRVAAGDWLFHQGEAADALFIVRSGRLEVLIERDGCEPEALHELGRGSVVGELALLTAGVRSAGVRSRRDATLLRVDRDTFDALIADGSSAAAIARALGAQLQQSRLLDAGPPPGAITVAIVRRSGEERSAWLESELLSAVATLRKTAVLEQQRVRELAHDGDLGAGLAQVLDHVERDHELVLLPARGAAGDSWLECCVRQADRVVLFAGADTTDWMPSHELKLLAKSDVALLDGVDRPEVLALLDALEPRSTHRVRDADDVHRLARRLARRAVGLVLSGGGARALTHIGVIEELQAAGITIDRIGGASMGAFIGALLAQGMDAEEIEARCYGEFVRRNPFGDFRLPVVSLVRGARAQAMLQRNLPGRFEDLRRTFYCVTTDIISSDLIVHRRGELVPAIGASMAIPGVVAPVPLGQRLLVDGAVLDNLPVKAMADENEGPIIASDVTKPEQRALAPGEAPPEIGLIETLSRVMLLSTTDTEELGRRYADLMITPDYEFVGQLEFHMLDRMRDAGRRAALTALQDAPADLWG